VKSDVTVSKGAGAQVGYGPGGAQFRTYGNPIPYLLPWATALALLALALLVRVGPAHDAYAWYWSPFIGAMYAGLAVGAHYTSRARGRVHHTLATGGFTLAGAWSWWLAGVPHLTWRPFVVYVGCMVLVCGVSCMFSAWKEGAPGGLDMHGRVNQAIAQLKNLNEIRDKDGQLVMRYEMQPGVPASALQGATEELAALYDGVPPGGVRAIPSKTEARVGELRISPEDPFDIPKPYPGPSIRSGDGSAADPVVLGNRRGTEPLQLWLSGDQEVGRNASLIQMTGMPGAGKTEAIRTLLVEVLSRPDAEYWYGNSRKAAQEPAWIRKGAARWADNKRDVIRMLHDLRDEMPERSRILGEAGLDQWAKGCPLKLRLVVIDEAAGIAGDIETLLMDLAETLRSLGVVLLVGLQRAAADRWPTSARSNFGTSICFGVKDATDAGMALPEDVLDAGAAPWQWQNFKPGMCYLSAPGVDEGLWCEDARTFKPNRDLQAQWAEFFIAKRAGRQSRPPASSSTGPGTAVAPLVEEGELMDDDGPVGERPPAYEVDEVDQGEEELDVDQVDAEKMLAETEGIVGEMLDDDEGAEYDEEAPRAKVPADCADVMEPLAMPAAPAPGSGGMRLGLSPKMPPAQARAYARRHLAALHERGVETFKVEEIGDELLAAVGYKGSWLGKVLGEFCDERPTWLRRTDERGWYDILAAPVRALEGSAT
jgi:hypothetical protein